MHSRSWRRSPQAREGAVFLVAQIADRVLGEVGARQARLRHIAAMGEKVDEDAVAQRLEESAQRETGIVEMGRQHDHGAMAETFHQRGGAGRGGAGRLHHACKCNRAFDDATLEGVQKTASPARSNAKDWCAGTARCSA